MSTAPIDDPKPLSALADHDALPSGTRFGEFQILSVLGVGGFGIVYLAEDHSLERRVALKEYMPATLASRGAGALITVRSASHIETYAIGLRSFVNEARLLARFDHPSLVKVYRFWEDNATAYMVMPYLQGVTLRDTRRAMSKPPDEAWIRSVIGPILGALEQLHREGVYHRDIAPDNVLLARDGPPVLLDFGAARRVISDRTQSLTAILKPSYAPIEQYAEMTQMRQGPWTDLYALGAVIHYLLLGVPPAPATARAIQDDAEPIESLRVAGVSPRFMEVVAWMLALRPNHRPQNVAALRSVLDGSGPVPLHGTSTTPPGALSSQLPSPASAPSSAPAASRGDETTLAVTPHQPTEYVTTPHVAPSTAFPSTTEFQTLPQVAGHAAEAPLPQTYTPSAQMPTARQLPPEAPAEAGRSARPKPLPAAAAVSGANAARVATGLVVIRRSHKGLWIGSGVVTALMAAFVGWAVMGETGRGDHDSAAATDAAASAALAVASTPATATVAPRTPLETTAAAATPSTEGAATVLSTPEPLAEVATVPPGRVPHGAPAADASPSATVPNEVRMSNSREVTTAPLTPSVRTVDRPARFTPVQRAPLPTPATTDGAATTTAAPSTRPDRFAPDRGTAMDRSAAADRSNANAVGERALNAGAGLGTAASRARQQGQAVPSLANGMRTGSPTPSQLLEQSLTGRPVPTTSPPAITPTALAGPTSAREACGKRVFIALAVCMDERCEEPRFRNGAECVKILETKHSRENR